MFCDATNPLFIICSNVMLKIVHLIKLRLFFHFIHSLKRLKPRQLIIHAHGKSECSLKHNFIDFELL